MIIFIALQKLIFKKDISFIKKYKKKWMQRVKGSENRIPGPKPKMGPYI